MRIEIAEGDIVIDAEELAPLLNVAANDLPELMRTKAITSICERGVDDHEGHYRLSFFYRNRRLRLSVDPSGQVYATHDCRFWRAGLATSTSPTRSVMP